MRALCSDTSSCHELIDCVLQAAWKLLLSEGEKGVLMWAGSADEQGVYALVSALGALFVRIVLQPFEVRYTLSVP